MAQVNRIDADSGNSIIAEALTIFVIITGVVKFDNGQLLDAVIDDAAQNRLGRVNRSAASDNCTGMHSWLVEHCCRSHKRITGYSLYFWCRS